MSSGWRFALALFAVVAPGIAAAADLPASRRRPAPTAPAAYVPAVPDWIVTIGAEGRIIPACPGASDKKLGGSALPLFSIRQAGTPPDFFGPRDSFGFNVINLGSVSGRSGAAIHQSTQSVGSYAELNGLADVDYAAQVGAVCQFLAGVVAAAAWRSAPRHRRRNRRDRRRIPGCRRAGRAMDALRRTADDAANGCGDIALFQHHGSAGPGGEYFTTEPAGR